MKKLYRVYSILVVSISICVLPSCVHNIMKKRKTISSMNYQELKATKEKLAQAKDTHSMVKYLQKMVPLCEDLTELRDIMLELADLLFDIGTLEEAEKLYREFTKLYPSDTNVEYALYKAILCCFYKTLDPTRDQTKTQETLVLVDQFLERETLFTKYAAEVKKIGTTCNEKLAQAELNVIDFYIKRKKYSSAHHRIANFRKKYLENIPHMLVHLLHFEYNLAHLECFDEVAAEKRALLIEKFPNHPLTLAARGIKKNKQSMTRRF